MSNCVSWNGYFCVFQPKPKKVKRKIPTAPILSGKKLEQKKVVNPLFEKRPKNFGIGEELFFKHFQSVGGNCVLYR